MRKPVVMFTVRRLMVAVAAVAVVIGAAFEWRRIVERRSLCRMRAFDHEFEEEWDLKVAEHVEHGRPLLTHDGQDEYYYDRDEPLPVGARIKPVSAPERRREAAYHSRMKRAYERVACYPWLPTPVETEPEHHPDHRRGDHGDHTE